MNAIRFLPPPSTIINFSKQFDLADRLSHYVPSQNAKIYKFTKDICIPCAMCILHGMHCNMLIQMYAYASETVSNRKTLPKYRPLRKALENEIHRKLNEKCVTSFGPDNAEQIINK